MKPKLIILNGPLGSGKTTLATKYADEHPLTLVLDIDSVWAMISHWREQKDLTGPLAKSMAVAMAELHLKAGNDVIVPQIIQTSDLADRFKQLAYDCSAQYFEVLLDIDKEEAIRRFILRGQANGHSTGFRAGGTIDTAGREQKLTEMYDNMLAVAQKRPETIYIEPIFQDVSETYNLLLHKLI